MQNKVVFRLHPLCRTGGKNVKIQTSSGTKKKYKHFLITASLDTKTECSYKKRVYAI